MITLGLIMTLLFVVLISLLVLCFSQLKATKLKLVEAEKKANEAIRRDNSKTELVNKLQKIREESRHEIEQIEKIDSNNILDDANKLFP